MFVTGASAEISETNLFSPMEYWTARNGLPHDTVNSIIQTTDGFLWVGTASGLVRFDGLQFQPLSGEGLAAQFRRAAVTVLYEDHVQGLWIGASGKGLMRRRGNDSLLFNETNGLANLEFTGICEDASHTLWVGTRGGLFQLKGNQFISFSGGALGATDAINSLQDLPGGDLFVTARAGLLRIHGNAVNLISASESPFAPRSKIIGVHRGGSGQIWASSERGVASLSGTRKTYSFRSESSPATTINGLCETADGALWVSTSDRGLFNLSNDGLQPAPIQQEALFGRISVVYGDRWGNLWVGTRGSGLARLSPRQPQSFIAPETVGARHISSVCADHSGQLWVGTLEGDLLREEGGQLTLWAGGPSLTGLMQVQSICADARGRLWLAAWGDGLWQVTGQNICHVSTAEGLSDDAVCVVAAAPDGQSIWAGTQGGQLLHVNAGEGGPLVEAFETRPYPVTSLLVEANQEVWVGFEHGGVFRWREGKSSPVNAPQHLKDAPVRCLYRDTLHRLWVCTWGEGAFCLINGKWIQLSTSAGLPANNVDLVAQDNAGDFWFGGESGIYQVRKNDIDQFLSGAESGIESHTALSDPNRRGLRCASGRPVAAVTPNGNLWAATTNGLLVLRSARGTAGDSGPPVVLDRIMVNGEPVALENETPLHLRPGKHTLDFYFTAIRFNSPERIRFRHRMENFDRDWVNTEDARHVHYGPLPPGTYEFRVIAAGAEGIWNQVGAAHTIIIPPPFWRSWWFLTISALTAISAVWALTRYISERRVRLELQAAEQRHAMDRERGRIAKDMHDELGSKLTRISFLSEVARSPSGNTNGSEPVQEIAASARELLASMDALVWAINPRNDSLDNLIGYLDRHAKDYFRGTRIECDVKLPAELPHVPISSDARHNVFQTFQEVLNNVLKHSHASHVRVSITLQPELLEIQVADDGKGMNPDNHAIDRNGLHNMQTRMAAVGGSCEIRSVPGGGTAVAFRLPLQPVT